MITYFIDMNMKYSDMEKVCLEANKPGSRIIVPNETTKEFVEGFFWAKKYTILTEIIIDHNRFLTGADVFKAVCASQPHLHDEYSNLEVGVQEMYTSLARELHTIINNKGGW